MPLRKPVKCCFVHDVKKLRPDGAEHPAQHRCQPTSPCPRDSRDSRPQLLGGIVTRASLCLMTSTGVGPVVFFCFFALRDAGNR